MNGCEGFEIAIEMRLHGAADAEASRRLDAHLATCAACGAFESEARQVEESMKGDTENLDLNVDWNRLRSRVRRIKNENWYLPAGLFISLLTFVGALSVVRRTPGAWGAVAPLAGLLLAGFLVGLFVSLRRAGARLREARKAEETPDGLLAYGRKELDERIRGLSIGWLIMPLGAAPLLGLTAWNAHRAGFSGPVLVLSDWLLPFLFVGLGLHSRFVELPKLKRERAELA